MPASVTIRDETPTGGAWNEWSLDLSRESVTVRDLIRERVYQEVQDQNIRRQGARAYRGLVQPEGYEEAPNDPRSALRPRPIDWREQYQKAIDAFQSSQVLILIDDRQAESLDQVVSVAPQTSVTFLRLALLVGGRGGPA